MDMTSAGAAAPAATRHEFRFDGSGGEYFKIWIVNLALTIVTLGIYSAWAKVRNKRYFYGNTVLAGHNFEYHGDPVRILIGRLIALGLLLGYSITAALTPIAALIWFVIFLLATPWLIVSSLRFNARNSSYRNLRFDFHGGYWAAAKAYLLWPLLALISLGTVLPLAHRARQYFQINNHGIGGRNFHVEYSGGQIYMIYLAALGILAAGVIAIGILFAAAGLSFGGLAAGEQPPEPTPAMIGAFMVVSLAYLAVFLFLSAFVSAMTFNLALNNTRLNGTIALEAGLSPLAMCWILFSNTFLTLVTLGLYTPWAKVRLTRYLLAHMAVTGPAAMDGFVASAAAPGSAVGEEVAGFLDFDFSL
jgi:uncharacterized membrane protein YjgN (DUF898 family)